MAAEFRVVAVVVALVCVGLVAGQPTPGMARHCDVHGAVACGYELVARGFINDDYQFHRCYDGMGSSPLCNMERVYRCVWKGYHAKRMCLEYIEECLG